MLPSSFYKASITLIPKPNTLHTHTHTPQANILGEIRCKNSQENISKQIQHYIKKIIHHVKWGYSRDCRDGSILANQSMQYSTLTK